MLAHFKSKKIMDIDSLLYPFSMSIAQTIYNKLYKM